MFEINIKSRSKSWNLHTREDTLPQDDHSMTKNERNVMKESAEEYEMAKLIKKKAKLLRKEATKGKKDQKLNGPRQFTEWQNPLCEWLKPLGEWQSPLHEWQQPLSEWYVPSGSRMDRENKKQEDVIQF